MPKTASKSKKVETPMAKRNREREEARARMTPMAKRNHDYAIKKKSTELRAKKS